MPRKPHVFLSFDPNRDHARAVRVAAFVPARYIVQGIEGALENPGSFFGGVGLPSGHATNKRAMTGIDAVVFLLGRDSASSDWMANQIDRYERKVIPAFAVHIHMLPGHWNEVDPAGKSPFVRAGDSEREGGAGLRTYDWVRDDGPKNFAAWLEVSLGGR